MKRLIECVPNFSEGRDATKVEAIVAAMSKVPGVYVLDREMDADHNRCVITLVGEREAIEEAAIRGVGKAAELIDLTKQSGVHPRIGAADVIPFIPVSGASLAECAVLARQAGLLLRFAHDCAARRLAGVHLPARSAQPCPSPRSIMST